MSNLINLTLQNLSNRPELMYIVSPRKQRFLVIELHEDATNRPHINSCRIPTRVEEQLGRPIPSCYNVLGHQV